VQVGHNSLAEARLLAADAADAGADAVSATCPSYFKISSARVLVDCMAHLAEAAGDLPFFYYHIPRMTAAAVDMPEFLEKSEGCIPNLVGIKFTEPAAHDYQTSLEYDGGRYDILWGSDEMLASAVAIGARGAVGSTYNIAPGLYRQILAAMLRGDMETARALQSHSVAMIRILARGAFLPAMKEVMGMIGMPCGGCRLPLGSLSAPQVSALRSDLEAIGFFDWGGAAAATPEPSAARSTR
jgi:N-acetylneuraminate lyase